MDSRNRSHLNDSGQSDSYIISCKECSLNTLCLPAALEADEIDRLDEIVRRGRPMQRNQQIYEIGDPFLSIYAVRSGAIKAYSIDENGEEQVIGFYLPGEIFGLDAIKSNQHVSSAKALETSAVCELPFDQIRSLSAVLPNLQHHMYRVMSGEIQADQQLQLLLSKKTAEERIGTFLMNLSLRYRLRRLSPNSFRLPMARTDIGNYLGLAVETVSRVFTRLQNNSILKVDGKEVSIINHESLCEIAHNFQSYHP